MDKTEEMRRALVGEINAAPGSRAALEELHGAGNVLDTEEVRGAYEVIGFAAPFMIVQRRADGVKGSLMFQHSPRFYWGFQAD